MKTNTTGLSAFFHGREAERRRAIDETLRSVFHGWGYDEIVAPLFDDAATFDPALSSSLYSFTGRDGRALALRPDFTGLVARIAATRLRDRPAPLRLFYSGEVVRHQPARAGREGEFHQAGLEFLGVPSPVADAEVLAIAIECLDRLGLSDSVIVLGHVRVARALLDALDVPQGSRRHVQARLAHRDPSGLSALFNVSCDGDARAGRLLVELASDQGIRQDLEAAEAALSPWPDASSAVLELKSLMASLVASGLGARFAIDLSENRGLDYYTGLVFRVYVPGAGGDLGGGGRYDDLLAKFGRNMPAIGFMFGLDRLSAVIEKRSATAVPEDDVASIVPARDLSAALVEARARRERGERVQLREDLR